MRWKVEVRGHQFDLADLEVAVGGLGGRSFKDGEKTFLYAEAFNHMHTPDEVNRAAEAMVATVNASLRLSDHAAQPITVGPVVGAHGATHFAMLAETVAFRARFGAVMTRSGEEITEPSSTECVSACNFDPPRRGIGVQN